MTATARQQGCSLRHRVDLNGRHALITDEPESLGGADSGPAPHELIPAALAACVSSMVVLYGTRKGWSLEGVSVDVEYDDKAEPRRCEVVVNLPDGLSESQIDRLRKVAASCPVKRALETGFEVTERFEVVPDRAGVEAA